MPISSKKLASIMFTDIVGYTKQMSDNEDKAFALIKKKRKLLLPLIDNHEGKLIKEIGDGTLSRYFKADDAIDCANSFQSRTGNDLKVRVGIHTGEVIIDNEDVFGDVVNVASRLESIAVPGSVLISKETVDKLDMSNDLELVSLGMQSLKGVGRLIEVYAIKQDSLVVPQLDDFKKTKIEVHDSEEVPSIAIMPFENKGSEKDIFYAYGISSDLISDCSSAGLIRVASLNDIEKIDYRNMDSSSLSKTLLVRYIAQGVLWKMGEIFQLSIELYDTKDKKVVWSDRWQEKWDNLPMIKGNLSDGLLKALNITKAIEKRFETANPEAYKLYLKAKYNYDNCQNKKDLIMVQKLIKKVLVLDNHMVSAGVLKGATYWDLGDYDQAMKIYTSTLKKAKKIDDKNGVGLCLNCIGIGYSYSGYYEKGLDCFFESLKIRKILNDKRGVGDSYNNIGNVNIDIGNYEEGLNYYLKALFIDEELCDMFGKGISLSNIGNSYYLKGDYDKALDYLTKSLKIKESLNYSYGLIYTLGNIGNVKFAQQEFESAIDFLKKSLKIQKEMGHKEIELETTVHLYLIYESLGIKYDKNHINKLIEKSEYIEFEINLRLYMLLNKTEYIIKAYKQIQDKMSSMSVNRKTKFIAYPIPALIIDEFEKSI